MRQQSDNNGAYRQKKKKKKRVRNHEEETWAGGILYSACLSSNKHWDQGQETASGIATAHLKKKKMFPLGLETKGCKKKKRLQEQET